VRPGLQEPGVGPVLLQALSDRLPFLLPFAHLLWLALHHAGDVHITRILAALL
jgi:hypothetical protein